MSTQNQFHANAYGIYQAVNNILALPIIAKRNPNTADKAPLGQIWINTSTDGAFMLTSIVNNSANWVGIVQGGGAGNFTSLTVNPGPTALSTVGNGNVTIGNAANTGIITIDSGVGGFNLNGNANAINIATDNAASTLTIGNAASALAIDIEVGTGNLVMNGNGNHIHIGDDAAANTVSLGSVTAGAQTIISGGAGTGIGGAAIVLETDATGDIQIGDPTHTGTIFIGTSTAPLGESIYVGASLARNTVIVGSTFGASLTQVQAGTGGLSLNAAGNLSAQAALGNAASPTAAVTVNHRMGVATFTGFTTANAGATQAFTINNNTILANSGIFCTVTHLNASTNGALLRIEDITQAVGSIVVTVSNNGAGALGAGDDVLITFWVID